MYKSFNFSLEHFWESSGLLINNLRKTLQSSTMSAEECQDNTKMIIFENFWNFIWLNASGLYVTSQQILK